MSFGADQRRRLHRICRTGAENPDSVVGCYILRPGDLHEFSDFFSPLIREHHAAQPNVTEWGRVDGSNPDELDLAVLRMPPLSMRMRVGRNLKDFPLPGSMDRADRIRLERAMVRALQVLIEDPARGGRVYSLTPEFGPNEPNPNLITADEYRDLVDAHLMFKSMDGDRYMKSAGLAADWPYGRACYVSRDNAVIVWIGEEDHLRIIHMTTGTSLTEAYERLRDVLAQIEAIAGIEFAHDGTYGYITSCPSNLGTSLRASVRVLVPPLASPGVDMRAVCGQFGLAVCGPAGEHSPIFADGRMDLSPIRRLFLTDRDILAALFRGLSQLANWVSAEQLKAPREVIPATH